MILGSVVQLLHFLFLHQTATHSNAGWIGRVATFLVSTSNRNLAVILGSVVQVATFLVSTSNRNQTVFDFKFTCVATFLVSTSNRNLAVILGSVVQVATFLVSTSNRNRFG